MFVIIGASSFIGVYTATYFVEQGERVVVTGRNNKFKEYYDEIGAEYINLDLTKPEDFEKLPKKDVEGVVLISGALPASENADLKENENADQYVKTNVLGTCYALEYCRKRNIKRLISTISYGEIAGSLKINPPIDESEPRNFEYKGDHAVYVISKGATPKDISKEIDEHYCIRFLKSENIVDNQLKKLPEFGITSIIHETELKRSQLREDDILFVIAGASIGKTAIMKSSFIPANTNQATCFIRIKSDYKAFQKYIWFVLQSDLVKKYISLYAVQSAQPNLSMENLGEMRIPYPNDYDELITITKYLDETSLRIDNLINNKLKLLCELEAYKKSLIFEYVTGKKEVIS